MKAKKEINIHFEKREPKESCMPLDLCEMFQLNWWSVLEAAFILSEWPEYEHFWSIITPKDAFPADILENRKGFFLPGHFPLDPGDDFSTSFDPKKYSKEFQERNYSKKFQEIFRNLNRDINDKKLLGKHCFVWDGIYNFVQPFDAIIWALRNGYIIPNDVQKWLSIKQIHHKQLTPWLKKIEVMAVSQCYCIFNSKRTLKDVFESGWVQKYGGRSEEQQYDLHHLRRDLGEILEKGRPGRPGADSDAGCKILLGIIPDVLKKRKGHWECDFDLLDRVINQVAWMKVHTNNLKNYLTSDDSQYVEFMKGDILISEYLKKSPTIVQFFIEKTLRVAFSKLHDFYFWKCLPDIVKGLKFK